MWSSGLQKIHEHINSVLPQVHHQESCPGFPINCSKCNKAGIPRAKVQLVVKPKPVDLLVLLLVKFFILVL